MYHQFIAPPYSPAHAGVNNFGPYRGINSHNFNLTLNAKNDFSTFGVILLDQHIGLIMVIQVLGLNISCDHYER